MCRGSDISVETNQPRCPRPTSLFKPRPVGGSHQERHYSLDPVVKKPLLFVGCHEVGGFTGLVVAVPTTFRDEHPAPARIRLKTFESLIIGEKYSKMLVRFADKKLKL